jgi:hypothetical protein
MFPIGSSRRCRACATHLRSRRGTLQIADDPLGDPEAILGEFAPEDWQLSDVIADYAGTGAGGTDWAAASASSFG